MAKIFTLKTSVKIGNAPQEHENSEVQSSNELPSAHIIQNILNYSKALEVKRTSEGAVIENVMN